MQQLINTTVINKKWTLEIFFYKLKIVVNYKLGVVK